MAGAKDSAEPAGKKAKVDSVETKSMSSKAYLDQYVVPQLLPALTALTQERPPNPIDFLANYLITHKKSQDDNGSTDE
jgi:protein dpy-30